MPFSKVYECICDYCGETCYHIYDKSRDSLKEMRNLGIIISNKGKEVYCDEKCLRLKCEEIANKANPQS